MASPARSLAGGSRRSRCAEGLVGLPGLRRIVRRAPTPRSCPPQAALLRSTSSALGVGERGERVALGRMQPAAAEIERQAGDALGPRPSAEPRQRLDQQDRPPGPRQPAGGGDPRRPGAHDGHVDEVAHPATAPVAPSVSAGAMPTRSPFSIRSIQAPMISRRPPSDSPNIGGGPAQTRRMPAGATSRGLMVAGSGVAARAAPLAEQFRPGASDHQIVAQGSDVGSEHRQDLPAGKAEDHIVSDFVGELERLARLWRSRNRRRGESCRCCRRSR